MGEKDLKGKFFLVSANGQTIEMITVEDCNIVIEKEEQKEIISLEHLFQPMECEFTVQNAVWDRNFLLSLLHGRKVTNNWLKQHGGVMTRNKGRRK
jgi:hypothetical protein